MITHEVPQEVGDFALLRAAGMPRRQALLALAGVQLTAAIGAAGVLIGARQLHTLTGAVLAVAAGTFLHIGATDLLPEIHSAKAPEKRVRIRGFVLGLGLIVLATLLERWLA